MDTHFKASALSDFDERPDTLQESSDLPNFSKHQTFVTEFQFVPKLSIVDGKTVESAYSNFNNNKNGDQINKGKLTETHDDYSSSSLLQLNEESIDLYSDVLNGNWEKSVNNLKDDATKPSETKQVISSVDGLGLNKDSSFELYSDLNDGSLRNYCETRNSSGCSSNTDVPLNNKNELPSGDTSKDKASGDTSKDKASGDTSKDRPSVDTNKDRPSVDTSKDKASGDTSKDKASGDTSKDKASGDTSKDKASGDTSKDKASVDTSKDRPSVDTSKDKASGDTSKDKASGDTSKDKASGDTNKDKASVDTSKDKASGDTSKDKASGDMNKDKASVDTSKDKASGDTSKDKASGDTNKDKASGDTNKDKASGDTNIDKASGDHSAVKRQSSLDLYTELVCDDVEQREVSNQEIRRCFVEAQSYITYLHEKLDSVMKNNEKLLQENIMLKKNISSVFLTAQTELRRKQSQLATLRRNNHPSVVSALAKQRRIGYMGDSPENSIHVATQTFDTGFRNILDHPICQFHDKSTTNGDSGGKFQSIKPMSNSHEYSEKDERDFNKSESARKRKYHKDSDDGFKKQKLSPCSVSVRSTVKKIVDKYHASSVTPVRNRVNQHSDDYRGKILNRYDKDEKHSSGNRSKDGKLFEHDKKSEKKTKIKTDPKYERDKRSQTKKDESTKSLSKNKTKTNEKDDRRESVLDSDRARSRDLDSRHSSHHSKRMDCSSHDRSDSPRHKKYGEHASHEHRHSHRDEKNVSHRTPRKCKVVEKSDRSSDGSSERKFKESVECKTPSKNQVRSSLDRAEKNVSDKTPRKCKVLEKSDRYSDGSSERKFKESVECKTPNKKRLRSSLDRAEKNVSDRTPRKCKVLEKSDGSSERKLKEGIECKTPNKKQVRSSLDRKCKKPLVDDKSEKQTECKKVCHKKMVSGMVHEQQNKVCGVYKVIEKWNTDQSADSTTNKSPISSKSTTKIHTWQRSQSGKRLCLASVQEKILDISKIKMNECEGSDCSSSESKNKTDCSDPLPESLSAKHDLSNLEDRMKTQTMFKVINSDRSPCIKEPEYVIESEFNIEDMTIIDEVGSSEVNSSRQSSTSPDELVDKPLTSPKGNVIENDVQQPNNISHSPVSTKQMGVIDGDHDDDKKNNTNNVLVLPKPDCLEDVEKGNSVDNLVSTKQMSPDHHVEQGNTVSQSCIVLPEQMFVEDVQNVEQDSACTSSLESTKLYMENGDNDFESHNNLSHPLVSSNTVCVKNSVEEGNNSANSSLCNSQDKNMEQLLTQKNSAISESSEKMNEITTGCEKPVSEEGRKIFTEMESTKNTLDTGSMSVNLISTLKIKQHSSINNNSNDEISLKMLITAKSTNPEDPVTKIEANDLTSKNQNIYETSNIVEHTIMNQSNSKESEHKKKVLFKPNSKNSVTENHAKKSDDIPSLTEDTKVSEIQDESISSGTVLSLENAFENVTEKITPKVLLKDVSSVNSSKETPMKDVFAVLCSNTSNITDIVSSTPDRVGAYNANNVHNPLSIIVSIPKCNIDVCSKLNVFSPGHDHAEDARLCLSNSNKEHENAIENVGVKICGSTEQDLLKLDTECDNKLPPAGVSIQLSNVLLSDNSESENCALDKDKNEVHDCVLNKCKSDLVDDVVKDKNGLFDGVSGKDKRELVDDVLDKVTSELENSVSVKDGIELHNDGLDKDRNEICDRNLGKHIGESHGYVLKNKPVYKLHRIEQIPDIQSWKGKLDEIRRPSYTSFETWEYEMFSNVPNLISRDFQSSKHEVIVTSTPKLSSLVPRAIEKSSGFSCLAFNESAIMSNSKSFSNEHNDGYELSDSASMAPKIESAVNQSEDNLTKNDGIGNNYALFDLVDDYTGSQYDDVLYGPEVKTVPILKAFDVTKVIKNEPVCTHYEASRSSIDSHYLDSNHSVASVKLDTDCSMKLCTNITKCDSLDVNSRIKLNTTEVLKQNVFGGQVDEISAVDSDAFPDLQLRKAATDKSDIENGCDFSDTNDDDDVQIIHVYLKNSDSSDSMCTQYSSGGSLETQDNALEQKLCETSDRDTLTKDATCNKLSVLLGGECDQSNTVSNDRCDPLNHGGEAKVTICSKSDLNSENEPFANVSADSDNKSSGSSTNEKLCEMDLGLPEMTPEELQGALQGCARTRIYEINQRSEDSLESVDSLESKISEDSNASYCSNMHTSREQSVKCVEKGNQQNLLVLSRNSGSNVSNITDQAHANVSNVTDQVHDNKNKPILEIVQSDSLPSDTHDDVDTDKMTTNVLFSLTQTAVMPSVSECSTQLCKSSEERCNYESSGHSSSSDVSSDSDDLDISSDSDSGSDEDDSVISTSSTSKSSTVLNSSQQTVIAFEGNDSDASETHDSIKHGNGMFSQILNEEHNNTAKSELFIKLSDDSINKDDVKIYTEKEETDNSVLKLTTEKMISKEEINRSDKTDKSREKDEPACIEKVNDYLCTSFDSDDMQLSDHDGYEVSSLQLTTNKQTCEDNTLEDGEISSDSTSDLSVNKSCQSDSKSIGEPNLLLKKSSYSVSNTGPQRGNRQGTKLSRDLHRRTAGDPISKNSEKITQLNNYKIPRKNYLSSNKRKFSYFDISRSPKRKRNGRDLDNKPVFSSHTGRRVFSPRKQSHISPIFTKGRKIPRTPQRISKADLGYSPNYDRAKRNIRVMERGRYDHKSRNDVHEGPRTPSEVIHRKDDYHVDRHPNRISERSRRHSESDRSRKNRYSPLHRTGHLSDDHSGKHKSSEARVLSSDKRTRRRSCDSITPKHRGSRTPSPLPFHASVDQKENSGKKTNRKHERENCPHSLEEQNLHRTQNNHEKRPKHETFTRLTSSD